MCQKSLKNLFRQMSHYMGNFLSKHQCGFRKVYNTQYCLLKILEKWKSAVDKGKSFGALLTDLSTAFDCLSHHLLLVKLHAYRFSLSALNLIHSYLKNRKQRTKIDSTYSTWDEILFGVPQGSILGPLPFNIFLCDLFFSMNETDFASYANGNTPYVTGNSTEDVINSLKNVSITLFKWFADNQMKANKGKCQLLISSSENVTINVDGNITGKSICEKLLSVNVDYKLKFSETLDSILKKSWSKSRGSLENITLHKF